VLSSGRLAMPSPRVLRSPSSRTSPRRPSLPPKLALRSRSPRRDRVCPWGLLVPTTARTGTALGDAVRLRRRTAPTGSLTSAVSSSQVATCVECGSMVFITALPTRTGPPGRGNASSRDSTPPRPPRVAERRHRLRLNFILRGPPGSIRLFHPRSNPGPLPRAVCTLRDSSLPSLFATVLDVCGFACSP